VLVGVEVLVGAEEVLVGAEEVEVLVEAENVATKLGQQQCGDASIPLIASS